MQQNCDNTFVPSASANPPPTSRATFHGMDSWNSFHEIIDSGLTWQVILGTSQIRKKITVWWFSLVINNSSWLGFCWQTVFCGQSMGRYNEEEEAQQQSYGGISDVFRVPVKDIVTQCFWQGLFSATDESTWMNENKGGGSLREQRWPARDESWSSGQPQQHHDNEDDTGEDLLRTEGGWSNQLVNQSIS